KVDVDSLQPASTDASFRRYFRAQTVAAQKQSIIVMDAPPQQENNPAFVDNQQRLAKAGLKVPQIHEADLKKWFFVAVRFGPGYRLSRVARRFGRPCPAKSLPYCA